MDTQLSTGLPGLDGLLKGLMAGDNVVRQLESVFPTSSTLASAWWAPG